MLVRYTYQKNDYEVEAFVQKLIDEDKVHHNAVLDLALQFENSCTAKDDFRKAYEKCNDISQESRALIDVFLKEGSDKDYELNLFMYEKAAKIEKQMNAKIAWLLEKFTTAHKHYSGINVSTQQYMQQIIEDVGEDDDFNSGAWVSATNYVKAFGGNVTGCLGDINNFLKKGKLDQVFAIVKSCSPNVLGDLNVTMKDLSGAAMILSNVSVFTPKPSHHYLNITMKNVVEVFRKDTVLLGSGKWSSYSGKRSLVGRRREKADVAPESAGRDPLPCYYCWFKITAVGEKVNAAESLLGVSTEVNAD
ncbi:ribonuclease H-like domain-containing protein [Tanacetum coccineum]